MFVKRNINYEPVRRYVEILDACMHKNLMWLFYYRKHAGTPKTFEALAPIIAEVIAFKKFALLDSQKNLIKQSDARLKKRKSKVFIDITEMPIASHPSNDRQVKSSIFLLTNARESNVSQDIFREYMAVL